MKRIHSAHAIGKLSFKGTFHLQGPQPIDDEGGAPTWLVKVFEDYPTIDNIALSGDKHSVIYSRIKED